MFYLINYNLEENEKLKVCVKKGSMSEPVGEGIEVSFVVLVEDQCAQVETLLLSPRGTPSLFEGMLPLLHHTPSPPSFNFLYSNAPILLISCCHCNNIYIHIGKNYNYSYSYKCHFIYCFLSALNFPPTACCNQQHGGCHVTTSSSPFMQIFFHPLTLIILITSPLSNILIHLSNFSIYH